MNKEISLKKLWKVFATNWWRLVIVALVAMLIAGAFTILLIPKKYSSSVTFYIINQSAASDYTTSALLSATEQLANDYSNIITSDIFLVPMRETLMEQDIDYGTAALRSMISSSFKETSSVMTVKVTCENPEHAFEIAKYIVTNAPATVKEVTKKTMFEKEQVDLYREALMKLESKLDESDLATIKAINDSLIANSRASDCLEAVNYPVLDNNADSPSVVRNVAIAGLAAVLVLYLYYLIRYIFSAVIVNEEDIKGVTNVPIIGVIPSWEQE